MCTGKNITSEQYLREKIHELNNHLFAASGRLELLLEEEGLSGKVRDGLRQISGELEIVRQLVGEIHKAVKK